MLLRRITEHVKAQNWTAVALDFVIVVVGVFIGIQVANWNDARAIRKDQRAILEQLHADLAPRIEYWRSWNERQTLVDANEQLVIEALLRGALPQADIPRFEAGLVSLVEWYSLDVSLIQRRMESTEIFSEFQGTPYEGILVELHRNWALAEQVIAEYEARGNTARDIVFSGVFMAPATYNAPEPAELTPRYNFVGLSQDKDFKHAVAQLYHYNNRARSAVYRTFYGVEETVKRLETALYPDGNAPNLDILETETQ